MPGYLISRAFISRWPVAGLRFQSAIVLPCDGQRFSLSLEERAGVRTSLPLTLMSDPPLSSFVPRDSDRACVIRQWMRRAFLQLTKYRIADARRVSSQA